MIFISYVLVREEEVLGSNNNYKEIRMNAKHVHFATILTAFVAVMMALSFLKPQVAQAAPNAPTWVCSSLSLVSKTGLMVTAYCNYASSSTEKVDVDWGDGNVEILPSGTHAFNRSHTYAAAGHYKIALRVWNEGGTAHNDCLLEVDVIPDGTPSATGSATCDKWDGYVQTDKYHTATYTFKVTRNGAEVFNESGTLAKDEKKSFGDAWKLNTNGNVGEVYYKVVTSDGKKVENTVPFSLDCFVPPAGKCVILSINPPTSQKIDGSNVYATVQLGGIEGDGYKIVYKEDGKVVINSPQSSMGFTVVPRITYQGWIHTGDGWKTSTECEFMWDKEEHRYEMDASKVYKVSGEVYKRNTIYKLLFEKKPELIPERTQDFQDEVWYEVPAADFGFALGDEYCQLYEGYSAFVPLPGACPDATGVKKIRPAYMTDGKGWIQLVYDSEVDNYLYELGPAINGLFSWEMKNGTLGMVRYDTFPDGSCDWTKPIPANKGVYFEAKDHHPAIVKFCNAIVELKKAPVVKTTTVVCPGTAQDYNTALVGKFVIPSKGITLTVEDAVARAGCWQHGLKAIGRFGPAGSLSFHAYEYGDLIRNLPVGTIVADETGQYVTGQPYTTDAKTATSTAMTQKVLVTCQNWRDANSPIVVIPLTLVQ